ncbi:NUDIX domain-containing protein [Sphaerisporangium dianthi]|uniref:NUDIX domain-containing protein n=1 Tax=Sphaerisporangium dianthi TaxID=1436120 RepID=A0ABV9CF12_9ACTN
MGVIGERVRAVLITGDGHFLTIKRVRPGQAPYWVLPGGGVEPADDGLEAALHREIQEELAGQAEIHSLLGVVDSGPDRQHIYLARILRYDFAARSGPEAREDVRGEYLLHPLPLTSAALTTIALMPPQVATLLAHCLTITDDLFTLPDKRAPRHGSDRPPTFGPRR